MEHGLIALAAGLGLGLAAFGAALGQGRATAAAMESIGRNPNSADRIFTPLIVGLALMEALALYALVIAFILAGEGSGERRRAETAPAGVAPAASGRRRRPNRRSGGIVRWPGRRLELDAAEVADVVDHA